MPPFPPQKPSIKIDREGFFINSQGLRMSDPEMGRQWLLNLKSPDFEFCQLEHEGKTILVEAFDKPLVVSQVSIKGSDLELELPYHLKQLANLSSLSLDAWDRVHGLTEKDIPFVLSHKAQAELFNSLDEFSDDSISIGENKIPTEDFYLEKDAVSTSQFWTQIYKENPSPGWDMDGPHPALETILPQLKLLQGRFLVPGCGKGHDAFALAEAGHIVTGVDFSETALEEAKKKYTHPRLKWLQQDIFDFGQSAPQSYDYIFEHTCFCAISPKRRKKLVKVWFDTLAEGGHLLAQFFIHPRRIGPPFGTSEWELESLLSPYFDVRYWTRSKVSPGWREGLELTVYAEKKKGRSSR